MISNKIKREKGRKERENEREREREREREKKKKKHKKRQHRPLWALDTRARLYQQLKTRENTFTHLI
jgi:hypothetical protein